MATPLLCRACDRVSRCCNIFSDLSRGTRRPSVSGTMTSQDTTDCVRSCLASMHYPRIRGFRCCGLGRTHGFRLCLRHCRTNGWLSSLVYRSSLLIGAFQRQPMTLGCGEALVSPPGPPVLRLPPSPSGMTSCGGRSPRGDLKGGFLT